ncbi:MAG TPA: extensin family protein [Polyangiaceae bacterium]|nr:extensin family protein [Polyangiaceae bacterium]
MRAEGARSDLHVAAFVTALGVAGAPGCTASAPEAPRVEVRPTAPPPRPSPDAASDRAATAAPAASGDRAATAAPAASAVAPSPLPAAPPPRRPGAYANLDPDDDLVVGPPDEMAECEAELARAGVTFRRATLAVHVPKRSKVVCGAPQVITYLKGPGNVAYSSPPLLTCGMALALASFERILQDEAKRLLRSPVARVDHLGTYACREIAAYPGWVSEHSYANAIDLARFVLKNGTVIDVLHDFDRGDEPPKRPAGAFLRAVSQRANDEDVFSHVLTPFFDAGHKNHFHLDLARFRSDGTRPAPAELGAP